jgi:malonyl-CoA O-methyltransferase
MSKHDRAALGEPVPPTQEVVPTRPGYDRWAEIYDAEDNPLVLLEERYFAGLLGDVAGRSIVDVGCGTGRHAVRLANAGARVTAVDFSEEMLRRARAKPGALAVTFLCHDLDQPLPLHSGAFERVLCCLVADHIADLGALFGELGRLCTTDGFLLFSVMHPAMLLRGVQARFIDPATGRRVGPHSYPYQLSDYVIAAVRAGLLPDHLSEHAVDDELAARSPRASKYLGWPLLFLMRLRPNRRNPLNPRRKKQ